MSEPTVGGFPISRIPHVQTLPKCRVPLGELSRYVRYPYLSTLSDFSGIVCAGLRTQLGHADPALTLRVYAHALKGEERDLSFAEFGPGRPYTAPGDTDSDRAITQPRENFGGPPGTRTLDHRVKSPVLYQLS